MSVRMCVSMYLTLMLSQAITKIRKAFRLPAHINFFWHIQIVFTLIFEGLDSIKPHEVWFFANQIQATFGGCLKFAIPIWFLQICLSPDALVALIRFQSVFWVTWAHNDNVKSRVTEVHQSGMLLQAERYEGQHNCRATPSTTTA